MKSGYGFSFFLFPVLCFLVTAFPCRADELPRMDEVIVVSPSSGRFLNAPGAGTTVITAAEIERMQVKTLPDLLNTLSSVLIAEKGPGSQADISVRGSSTEGVLLLVNGIRVRDPQTGHFLMDIPLDFGNVERVEILSGGGSPQYGSSAVGGIVNVVTREGRDGGGISAGSFGSVRAGGSVSASLGNASFTAGIHGGHSDGYTEDSDIGYTGADVSGTWRSGVWDVRWNAGVMEKKFGAQGFYASYPSYEEVMTVQTGVNAIRTLDDRSLVRFRAGGRGHADDFMLLRNDPDYYRNTHYNRDYTLGGEYVRTLGNSGSALFGAESGSIGITSGKLGNRSDNGGAVYGEYTGALGKGGYSLSLRYDRGYTGEHVLSPGIGAEIPLSSVYTVRFRAGRSFREPTYTERYYNDPANQGDPNLRAERSGSVEGGITRKTGRSESGLTVFTSRTVNVIDWVRSPGETAWSAVNHSRLATAGSEVSYAAGISADWRFRGNATVLRQRVHGRKGLESKYALNPAEEAVSGMISGPLGAKFEGSFSLRYERMSEGDVRSPADVRISRRFGRALARWSALNIGNERYEEIPGLRAPGRRYLMELEYSR